MPSEQNHNPFDGLPTWSENDWENGNFRAGISIQF